MAKFYCQNGNKLKQTQIDFDKSPIALKVKQQLSFITIPFSQGNVMALSHPKKFKYNKKKQFSKLEKTEEIYLGYFPKQHNMSPRLYPNMLTNSVKRSKNSST